MSDHGHDHEREADPALEEFWNERYELSARIWSGNPNPQLVAEVDHLVPGRALGVGCGEGADAILLGAVGPPVGDTTVPPGTLERGLLLKIRFELDLYVNLRPFHGVPGSIADGADFAVVRENTEGTYAGEGGFLRKGTPRRNNRLTLVHKTNVLTFAGDLWSRTEPEWPNAICSLGSGWFSRSFRA